MVGCPVAHREWILPTWLRHVTAAADVAGLEPEIVLLCSRQDPSWNCVAERVPDATLIEAPFHRPRDDREWNPPRYLQMVELRNRVLAAVRQSGPDLFLSLDSDILLHPDHLKFMIEALDRFDAVGGRCYMTSSGTRFPSWARLARGSLQRIDSEGTFAVDVIMACKLMTPPAYNVDYRFDLQGEDIGWSTACTERGLRLGWEGRVISKHVLAPHLLTPRDARVGF